MMPNLLETLLIAAKEEIRDTGKDSFEQRTLCIGGLANMCAGHELCRSIQKHGISYHIILSGNSSRGWVITIAVIYANPTIGALDFVLHWLHVSMERYHQQACVPPSLMWLAAQSDQLSFDFYDLMCMV
jgi:hypothetical protein